MIKILTLSGDYISLAEWQQQYGLVVGSENIGKYFKYTEGKFAQDLSEYGELIVCEPLMHLMDEVRELSKRPFKVNSFNRNEAKQNELKASGFRAATTSPHVVKMACDMDTTSKEDTLAMVPIVKQAAKNKNLKVRIGYKEYLAAGQSFIHMDVCPEYYGSGGAFASLPNPAAWRNVIEW